MEWGRRDFLVGGIGAFAASPRLLHRTAAILRPEDFGARGDGSTNDSRAFAALSDEINRRSGGTIALTAGRTYMVGAQERGGPQFGWEPAPILDFKNLSGPLVILGNGARLRCLPGLRYGTFDLVTGQPVDRPKGQRNRAELASPYRGMISVTLCKGPVTIRDVELDGNATGLIVGGRFGDKGWQIPATGLVLTFNSGVETIDNVHSHNHALDGAIFKGNPARTSRSDVRRLVCTNNGRQGLSIVSGRGYDFADCEFSRTGRGSIASAPRAGVDIEAEGRTIRDVSFLRCKFVDNFGAGLTAEAGDSEDLRFTQCLFVGTSNWSAWARKPKMVFNGCTFVGALVHAYGDSDPSRAARFVSCRFTDDPSLSPTGVVFAGRAGEGPIAVLGPESQNASFERCSFDLVGGATLPRSPPTVIYRDCTMRQRSSRVSAPRGRYFGTNRINGAAILNGSTVEGSVILNGRALPRGPISET